MARPRIRPSARKIPISISVSPALADKIDEYSHQIRFSRSKFLTQAVTEAINKIELRHDLDDHDHRNFTDDRMLMLAKVRLDGADEINPIVLAQLKDAIKSYEDRTATIEPMVPLSDDQQEISYSEPDITFYRVGRTANVVALDLTTQRQVAEIVKLDYKVNPYTIVDQTTGEQTGRFRLLRQAKEQVLEIYG